MNDNRARFRFSRPNRTGNWDRNRDRAEAEYASRAGIYSAIFVRQCLAFIERHCYSVEFRVIQTCVMGDTLCNSKRHRLKPTFPTGLTTLRRAYNQNVHNLVTLYRSLHEISDYLGLHTAVDRTWDPSLSSSFLPSCSLPLPSRTRPTSNARSHLRLPVCASLFSSRIRDE